MSRRKARVLAFQALYCYEAASTPVPELLKFEWEGEKTERFAEGMRAFAGNLIAGTVENLQFIDETIKKYLKHWEITRIKKVDLAILRISVYSLFFQKDIPPNVVIEEAVSICLLYGDKKSSSFINGILESIKVDSEKAGTP